jgi:hypothetical protein
MYTGSPPPPLPPEKLWADGMIHLAQQGKLKFGSDRRVPVDVRPVVTVNAYGGRITVLPCTSQDQSDNREFFELTEGRVMWSHRPTYAHTFASRWYEALAPDALHPNKIGLLHHPARLELLRWLRERS